MAFRGWAAWGAMALAIGVGGVARAEEDTFPGANRMDEFERAVARSVFRVIPAKYSADDNFTLAPTRVIPGSTGLVGIPTSHVFIAEDLQPIVLECERAAAFRIMRAMSGGSGLAVGQCDSQRAKAELAVKAAPAAMKRIAAEMFKGSSPEALEKMGWNFRVSSPAPDVKIYNIPLVAGGHGFVILRSVVAMSPRHVVAIRADLSMCAIDPRTGEMYPQHKDFKLCTQPEETLAAFAREVLATLDKG